MEINVWNDSEVVDCEYEIYVLWRSIIIVVSYMKLDGMSSNRVNWPFLGLLLNCQDESQSMP